MMQFERVEVSTPEYARVILTQLGMLNYIIAYRPLGFVLCTYIWPLF